MCEEVYYVSVEDSFPVLFLQNIVKIFFAKISFLLIRFPHLKYSYLKINSY